MNTATAQAELFAPEPTPEATRAAGLGRLADFVPRAGRAYAAGRNFDPGPGKRTAVSELSPWVRHRLVLESEVARAALERHGLDACEKFFQEVCWRTYWKGWLELRPDTWADYREQRDRDRAQAAEDGDLGRRLAAAEAGETGIEAFDAWARELPATGYLHNHTRMWFASIWVFTLELPWTLGADFFIRHLADGDPASNTLSWRWVAGLQTRGKTYLARPGNIERYTNGRFTPTGLSATAEALDEPKPPPPRELPAAGPIDTDRPVALLLTDDDLHPESLGLDDLDISAIATADASSGRSDLPLGQVAGAFAADALADGRERAAAHFGVEAGDLGPRPGADSLRKWVREAGVRQVLVPSPCTGPVRDWLDPLALALSDADIELVPLRRAWDDRLWPHATHGFFRFRKHLPKIAERLQDDAGALALAVNPRGTT